MVRAYNLIDGGGEYTPPKKTWTQAGVVTTVSGETIPVNNQGVAQDGSVPIAGTPAPASSEPAPVSPSAQNPAPAPASSGKTLVSQVQDAKGNVFNLYTDGTRTAVTPGVTAFVFGDGTSIPVSGSPATPASTTTSGQLTQSDIDKAVEAAINKTITALNSSWQAKYDALTNQQRTNNQASVTSAIEDFRSSLRVAGLDSLADVIDGYIKQDMTAAQIKINLTQTPQYAARFPGMAALQKAGMAVNEATYISMERQMRNILSAYGLDEKVFGSTAKLGEVIANQVSPAEYEGRVQMAVDRVNNNKDVLASLNEYYGVDTAGAISYLLDPKTGMDVVKKQIRASEIGAAAEMYQFGLSKAEAESYVNVSGTADLNSLKESFGKARILAQTQTRLSAIEGQKYDELEAVATVLGQDYQRQLESQRRALREQARFAGQSGVTSSSLKTASNI